MTDLSIPLSEQVTQWMEGIADHAQAAQAIGALDRDAAIGAIHDYLRRGPQVIPQPRMFAVTMLARWNAAEAIAALREVLHDHPLRTLSPQMAESEYVVKNAIVDTLAERTYPELVEDIAFGINERLPAAVRAAGGHGLREPARAIADLLDDDVLADTAAQTLNMLGDDGARAMLQRLDAWLWLSPYNPRTRLAVMRGLTTLTRFPNAGRLEHAEDVLRRALRDPHPLTRAAAAAALAPRTNAELVEARIRGVLGQDRNIAQACRNALAAVGAELVEPAMCALRRNAEPDLYGQEQAPPEEQRHWLILRMLEADRPHAHVALAELAREHASVNSRRRNFGLCWRMVRALRKERR
jgi:hypothetical protein